MSFLLGFYFFIIFFYSEALKFKELMQPTTAITTDPPIDAPV
mgnify:CR=1 FL=1